MSNKPKSTNSPKAGNPPRSKSAELAAAANQRKRDELEARRKKAQKQQQTLILVGAVALLVIIVVGIVLLSQPVSASFQPDADNRYDGIQVGTTTTGPNASIQYPVAFPYMGSPTAPVKIEEISSFSCPFCMQYHDNTLTSILDEIKAGRAQFVYIFTTNTGDYDSHPNTFAAVCAMNQNKYWQMHDIMFFWQKTYGTDANNRARIEVAAQHIGLDMSKFDSCMTDKATADYVLASNDYANKRGMVGTPTVFLYTNGVQMQPATAASSSETPGSVAGLSLGNLRGVLEAASAPTKVATVAATSAATAAPTTAATAAPTAKS